MLKASKLLTARMSSSVWLDPSGRVIDAHDFHGFMAVTICRDEFDRELDAGGALDYLLGMGWIRIGFLGRDTYVECNRLDSYTLAEIQNFLTKNIDYKADYVFLSANHKPSVVIPYQDFETMSSTDDIGQYKAATRES